MDGKPVSPEDNISGFRGTRVYRVLEDIGIILAPTGLVTIISQILGVPMVVYLVVALAVSITCAMILFLRKYVQIMVLILLGTAVITLSTILAWQYYEQNRNPWSKWSAKISEMVKECKDDVCITDVLSTTPPPMEGKNVPARMEHDIRVGQIFAQNEKIMKMLNDDFGIKKDAFLGTGFSLPQSKTDYAVARVPEYLVKNMPEGSPDLITCKISSKGEMLDTKLRDLVIDNRHFCGDPKQWPKNWEKAIFDEELPALIRFQQLTENEYEANGALVGRKKAKRVFFSQLGTVWDSTLRKASINSGYDLTEVVQKENVKPRDTKQFYLWIYIPTHAKNAVPATWGNILANLDEWIKSE
jgi:hypothetical protein